MYMLCMQLRPECRLPLPSGRATNEPGGSAAQEVKNQKIAGMAHHCALILVETDVLVNRSSMAMAHGIGTASFYESGASRRARANRPIPVGHAALRPFCVE